MDCFSFSTICATVCRQCQRAFQWKLALFFTPHQNYPGAHSVVEAIFTKEPAVWVYAFSLNVHSVYLPPLSERYQHPKHHILSTAHTSQIHPCGSPQCQESSFLYAAQWGWVWTHPCIEPLITSAPSALFRYSVSSTVRTTCSCCSDFATCMTTVFSLSSSCAGTCILGRYHTNVCSGFMVLASWLNEVDRLSKPICRVIFSEWTFIDHPLCYSQYVIHYIWDAYFPCGRHLDSNKVASGAPICHDVICVACVWNEKTDRFVCGPTSYPAIYVHITMHLYIT